MKGQKNYNKALLKIVIAYALFTGIITFIFFFFLFGQFQKTNQKLVPPTTPTVTVTATPSPAVTQIPTPTTSTPSPIIRKFCGGIGGFECPDGYSCKLDGNYPDAGGHCVRGI